MVQCAWAAVRKGGSRFATLFARIKARRGAGRAICAVAAEMLRTIYHMLKDGTYYEELRGVRHQSTRQEQAQRLLRRLTRLGFAAEIKPMASTAG